MTAPELPVVRVLFDATRLCARGAQRPTGIDRVDLAYLQALSGAPGIELQLVRFGALGPALLSTRARETLGAHWREESSARAMAVLRGWLESPPGTPAPMPDFASPGSLARRLAGGLRLALEHPRGALRLAALLGRPGPCVYLNTSHGRLYRAVVSRWLVRRRLRSVFFLHDLIPIEHPQFNRAGEPERHVRRLRTIARHASRILVNSSVTRDALLRHLAASALPVPPVDVLPLGVEAPAPQPQAARPSGIEAQVPYFVILSTIEARKNHWMLLKVWQQLVATLGDAAPRLVLIGRRGWENRTVFKLLDRMRGVSRHVAECPGLDDPALHSLLRGARALLNPSLAEGYSLPVAEALALGTPVIASDIPAHREVADGRAELLAPQDEAAWLRAITEHAAEPSVRNTAARRLAAGFEAPAWSAHFSRALVALRAAALAVVAGAVLAGCGSYLPSAGPLRRDIQDEGDSGKTRPFVLVEVSQATLETLKQRPASSLAATFGVENKAPELLVGVGDGLGVTVWEAGTQPLFAASGPGQGAARATALPEQIVDRDGAISVPFAGRIHVEGQTLVQVQVEIEHALAGKTARPQVLVTLTRNVSNAVTVVGEAAAGGRVALSPRGDRLLDVLAGATAGRAPTFETRVTLQRGAARVSEPLSAVLADPGENLFLHPGDTLVITRQPETFTAFGATGRNAQIPFDTARVNLVEAVAKAGGLQDLRADPQGVFLFRREPGELADKLRGQGPEARAQGEAVAGASVPVVYRLDLTRAGGYFLAREFELRDGDVLYVSSAPANELQKFLQLLGLATQPAANGAIIDNALRK